MAIDQNGNAGAQLKVVGKAPEPGRTAGAGGLTRRSATAGCLLEPAGRGSVKIANQADQPHFLVIQRVKATTTNATVRKGSSDSQAQPPWVLKATAQIGVIAAGHVADAALQPARG